MDGGWARQGRKGDKIVMLHLLNNQAVNQMLVTVFFFLSFSLKKVIFLLPNGLKQWFSNFSKF